MFTDEQINELTISIILKYDSNHSLLYNNVHPGYLQDAVRKALQEMK